MFENPRRGRQARNFGKNVPKIIDLKSSSDISENCRWVPLTREKLVNHEPKASDLQAFRVFFQNPK